MDLINVRLEYKNRLQSFIDHPRKKYLAHPKSKSARIDKQGVISHVKYGNPVQRNHQNVDVVICGSQNAVGTGIEVTALRFIAECVLGEKLYYWALGVEPRDGNYNNRGFDNVEFVETECIYRDEHNAVDFSGLKSVGSNWVVNGFSKIV